MQMRLTEERENGQQHFNKLRLGLWLMAANKNAHKMDLTNWQWM